MKKKTGLWILISFLLMITVLYVSWQMLGISMASADTLSKQEARILIRERYQGKIKQITLDSGQYHIELEKQDNLYSIRLDALSGKVLSFTKTGTTLPPVNQPPVTTRSEEKIKNIILSAVNGTITSFERTYNDGRTSYNAVVKEGDKQTSLTVDAMTGKILSSTSTTIDESSKKLTETEARDIAKKQVKGSIDHIWLETNGTQTYYLVEIKTQDDRESVVQIHAITGEVMSVTWDDHKDSNKDNKDEDD
jgi:uncharacterized membrane protein YkoI